MHDPVVLSDGHRVDRTVIVEIADRESAAEALGFRKKAPACAKTPIFPHFGFMESARHGIVQGARGRGPGTRP